MFHPHDTITVYRQASEQTLHIGSNAEPVPPTHQPWERLSLAELLRYRGRYFERAIETGVPYAERFQFDRHCAEIVDELSRRMLAELGAGR